MKDIKIFGGGLAGLTAAINLARKGYGVTVFEKESRIGGPENFTPSVQMTPIHFQKMKDYIGIDVECCFEELSQFKAYMYSKIVNFNTKHLYVTERGPRATSLDYYLYKIALEEGVNIEFSHPLKAENIENLTNNSIIAVGNYSPMVKYLKLPHIPFRLYVTNMETKSRNNTCLAYFDKYLDEYGYISAKNGLIFGSVSLLLNKPRENFIKFQNQLKQSEGIEFKKWNMVISQFPEKIHLLKKVSGKTVILAGSISGFFDPFFSYGVNSALISGKIASSTIISRKHGLKEFRRFMVNLNKMFLFARIYSKIPIKNYFTPAMFKIFNKNLPIFGPSSNNIPGFTHEDCFGIKNIEF